MDKELKERLEAFKAHRNRIMGRLLSRAFRIVVDVSSQKLAESGHESYRLGHLVLMVHIDLDGSTINELAAVLGITKQAVSKIVKELQEQGYVETEKHPDDARSVLVKITNKGARFTLEWQSCTKVVDRKFEEILGAERLEILKDILVDLADYHENKLKEELTEASEGRRTQWLEILQQKTVNYPLQSVPKGDKKK
ncbi:MarR family winged helix-turn-helix transcriptional regulator [Siphonobacter sp. SORGH_AS_1065]|uniref:MarR family winged helix-turn-helix transcriptional regulator n=1 Tax=Siphonobacter sp. SORGH_AS_1065 TaxID=3041795 RepID=UPI002786E175|nr:MarR family transcriptional regulator [Siphonobacter sp. SORGH_AS_1065]MDQ1086107.1 DNA-binding MarR family transcriptional regulator [Siphonobacter sp. SORGH_AS_1065]